MQKLERTRLPSAGPKSGEAAPRADASGVVTVSYARELNPVLAALRQNPLLRDLSEGEQDRLAASATLQTYPKHAYVFHRGDAGQSLCIVVSGVVEIILEGGSQASVSLSTCEAGDFFGEMALFDGQPRSATARALCDCQLLLIDRTALDADLLSRLSARISAALAQRLRKTDQMLADMAERVSRAAYANVNSAVAVELESIKALHRNTEQVAADTLARSERRAAEVMSRADAIAGNVQRELERTWSLLKRWVAPIAAALMAIATWYGITSIETIRESLHNFQSMYDEAVRHKQELEGLVDTSRQRVARLEGSYRRAEALQETAGELRAVRDAIGFDRTIDSPERLRRAALNYELAKQEIRERYLADLESGPQYEKYQASVVFEAVDTYVSLVLGGSDDGLLFLTRSERADLLMALVYTLGNLPSATSGQSGHAWRLYDRKVRDMLEFVIADADVPLRRHVTARLLERLRDGASQRAKENLALTLAGLGKRSPMVVQTLERMRDSKHSSARASALLALAQLGDEASYAGLLNLLQQSSPAAAYPTALLLAELGPSGLTELTDHYRHSDLPGLRERIEQVLDARTPKNCLEERYARYLLACLGGACPARVTDDESCPHFGRAQR